MTGKPICKADGCDLPTLAKGFCKACYCPRSPKKDKGRRARPCQATREGVQAHGLQRTPSGARVLPETL